MYRLLDLCTCKILSPTDKVPSSSAAPPAMIFVTNMPSSPLTCSFPTPPAMLKPRPLHIHKKSCHQHSIHISVPFKPFWFRFKVTSMHLVGEESSLDSGDSPLRSTFTMTEY